MDHWRLAYLGMRQIPRELSEFELATFFAIRNHMVPELKDAAVDLMVLLRDVNTEP